MMPPTRLNRLQNLFELALEQPPEERTRFANHACRSDSGLCADLVRLLHAHAEAGAVFLGVPDSAPDVADELRPGTVLSGRHAIRACIGTGGMSSVYKADDLQLGVCIALKVMNSVSADSLSRFRQEIQLARQITHPNIYRVFDVGSHEDFVYYTMELLPGETLAKRIMKGPIDQQKTLNILRQIAAGLEAAHARKIVHRDLKPSNIMLVPDADTERAVILDFGIAKPTVPAAEWASLTDTGQGIGTLAYMAPEQKRGEAITAQTDIYALALVTLEMLTCITPPGLTAISKAPAEWHSALGRALEEIPCHRFESAQAFTRALEKPAKGFVLGIRSAVAVGATGILVCGSVAYGPLRMPPPRRMPLSYETYLEGKQLLATHYKPGNLEAALTKFRTVVQEDPDSALAWAGLAEAERLRYIVTKEPALEAQATEHCKKALELKRDLPDAYITLGRVHTLSGKNQLAVEELEHARKLDPRGADAPAALSRALENLGRIAEAEGELRTAVMMRPDDWDTVNRLGAFYARQGQWEKARGQFRNALTLSVDNADAYVNLAVVEKNLRNLNEAERLLEQALRLKPSFAVHVNLGNLYFVRKNYSGSIQQYEKALSLNNRDYRVWGNLAWALLREGINTARTRRAFTEAMDRAYEQATYNKTDGLLQADLATFCAELRRPREANQAIDAATHLEPKNAEVLFRAAQATEMLGRKDEVLKLLRSALDNGLPPSRIAEDPELRGLWKYDGPAVRRHKNEEKRLQ